MIITQQSLACNRNSEHCSDSLEDSGNCYPDGCVVADTLPPRQIQHSNRKRGTENLNQSCAEADGYQSLPAAELIREDTYGSAVEEQRDKARNQDNRASCCNQDNYAYNLAQCAAQETKYYRLRSEAVQSSTVNTCNCARQKLLRDTLEGHPASSTHRSAVSVMEIHSMKMMLFL